MTTEPQFRTAVVPAAGLGTRFLPITKSVPKELLPVLDTPGIELVAAEAAAAGACRLVVVTAPGKEAVTDYFRPNEPLEAALAERGKSDLLDLVRRAPGLLEVRTAIQQRPEGLGHAIGCAEAHLTGADDAVAVLLPDDLILPAGILTRMAEVRAAYGGTVLCAFNAPRERLSNYGVFDLDDTDLPQVKRVRAMVEKPAPADAPSCVASAGRYLLDRAVFDALKHIAPGARGEYDLTDAIMLLIAEGHPVHVVVHEGSRHDIGNPLGLLLAAVDFALEDGAYGPELRTWLRGRIAAGTATL